MIEILLVEESHRVGLAVNHHQQHGIPILDWLDTDIVMQGPAALTPTENAHVVGTLKDGHASKCVLRFLSLIVVQLSLVEVLGQGNQGSQHCVW